MVAKTNYLKNLAISLSKSKTRWTFNQLAVELNRMGYKTTYGTTFKGSRGVAKLVSAVYKRLDKLGLVIEKNLVATAFTNANGKYAY